MASLVAFMQIRTVRTKGPFDFKQPWAFNWKAKGLKSKGPYYEEKWEWPSTKTGFSTISPKFQKTNHPKLHGYTGCQVNGLRNEDGTFTVVPEMVPQIVVPDLRGCQLKPYVSFRCTETKVVEPPITPKRLFELFYEGDVQKAFKNGEYDRSESVLENNRKKLIQELGIPSLTPD